MRGMAGAACTMVMKGKMAWNVDVAVRMAKHETLQRIFDARHTSGEKHYLKQRILNSIKCAGVYEIEKVCRGYVLQGEMNNYLNRACSRILCILSAEIHGELCSSHSKTLLH